MAISLLTARKKRSASMHFFFLEATTRFELVITVLQTDALPLGYVATSKNLFKRSVEDQGLEPGTDRL